MKFNFCYLCGHPATAVAGHGTERHWRCQSCGQTYYHNPKPATEAVLIDELGRIVVAVRARDPHKGKFDLPGGFVDAGETAEEALQRELAEELGLQHQDISDLRYLSSAVDHYPWGQETHTVMTLAFTARVSSRVQLTPQDDVAEVALRSIEELQPDDFAWPTQYFIIQAALGIKKLPA